VLQYWTEFFDELQNVRGRSLNTVMAYRRDLELFEDFKKNHSDVSRLFEFMQKRGLSKRSQARTISSIRTYMRFLESKGQNAPELLQLRPPKIQAKLPRVITSDEFDELLVACRTENPSRSYRNQLTLLMLFGLGVRVSELINMDVKNYDFVEKYLVVTGKGGKQRLVPVTEQLSDSLEVYLKDIRPLLMREPTDSILINDRGHRPSRVDIWRWLQAWSVRAGFEETMNPHKLRHGCATVLLNRGADLRSIQLLLGHSSIQTTQIYTSVSKAKLKDEILKKHPLSDSST
jgi:integrase/recombinase XerD